MRRARHRSLVPRDKTRRIGLGQGRVVQLARPPTEGITGSGSGDIINRDRER